MMRERLNICQVVNGFRRRIPAAVNVGVSRRLTATKNSVTRPPERRLKSTDHLSSPARPALLPLSWHCRSTALPPSLATASQIGFYGFRAV